MWQRTFLFFWLWVVASGALLRAQVVQLPTFRSFSVNTTVVVPDGGAAYLGGVSRAWYGSTAHGVPGLGRLPGVGPLFGNRSYAGSVSASHASVTATIIDLDEMDRAVLAAASGKRLAEEDLALRRRAAFLASHVARKPEALTRDVAGTTPRTPLAARNATPSPTTSWEVAQRAEAAGRLGAARCAYRRVARAASGPLKEQALARLAALSQPQPTAALPPPPKR